MRQLNICKVAGHACVRVQKEALPLMQRGHTVHLLSQKIPSFVESYDSYGMVHSIHQLRTMIEMYADKVDLFQAHNEPSWFVTAIKEICDKPVILDVHDSYLARSTPEESEKARNENRSHLRVSTEERNNFQLADGLVFPSQPFADIVLSEFDLRQPYRIVPSMVPKNLYVYQGSEWLPGMVYEGRVDLPPKEDDSKEKTGFTYTNYLELAQQCDKLDIDLHLYSRSDEPFKELYKDIAAIHQPVVYQKLFRFLARHDWGLVGNSFYTPEWNVALPNKLFEYVASGVPVVAINAAHCSEWLDRYGIGITVKSMEELRDRWREHTEVRKHLLKVRGELVMEKHIHVLEELYEEVLDGR